MADASTILRVQSLVEASDSTVVTEVVNLVEEQLKIRLGGSSSIPSSLQYIVVNVSVARYNQIGDEGKSSATIEGESASWLADLFAPYAADIQAYLDSENSTTGGVKVRFL